MPDSAFRLMTMGRTLKLIAPPEVSGGKVGEAVLDVPDVPCLPLDFVNSGTALRLGLEAPYKMRQTVIEGRVSVPAGAYVIFDGGAKKYPVTRSEPWDWPATDGSPFTLLIVEALGA